MGDVAVSNTVIARSDIGRFISLCEEAGARMMADIANDGANLSRELAPKGVKDDPRTPHLADSIVAESTSTAARWKATARHALAQELGSIRHPQSGWVHFFWEKEGREWEPGPNIIDHPGNPPHPYLRPAYEAMMARWMVYARRHYPR